MNNYLTPPMLSTGFSESVKSAKKRFANIFDRTNKKRGVWALVLVLTLAGVTGTMVACSKGPASAVNGQINTNNQQENPNKEKESKSAPDKLGSYAQKLYQYKGTNIDDKARVGAIIHALNFIDVPLKSIQLNRDSGHYVITVNYQVDSRANYRFPDDIMTGWNKNAAVMFSLIPNADYISFFLYDQYGEFAGFSPQRERLSEDNRMEYYTSDTMKEAASSLDSFTNYLNKVSAIKNYFYSEEQKQDIERDKQIYSVIGDDREIVVNSGWNFIVNISDAFAANPPIKELKNQKELFTQCKGKKIEFITYDIENYKTHDVTYYLFVFDGAKMIAYTDLKTASSQRNVINTLMPLQEH